MSVLHLSLYREHFVSILEGRKKIEYRDKTDYWCKRFKKKYSLVKFINGYGAHRPQMILQIESIIEKENNYEIKLGNIVSTHNEVHIYQLKKEERD